MKSTIGTVLKNARKNAGMTVKDVYAFLVENNVKSAPKTIYGWENDFSSPNVYIFLLLCKYYGIKDVLGTFEFETLENAKVVSFNEKEFSKEELDDIQRYAEFLKTKRKE